MSVQMPIIQAEVLQDLAVLLNGPDSGFFLLMIVSVIAGVAIAPVAIVSNAWKQVRGQQIAASLLQDMMDRNMSAQEIHQLLSDWAAASGGEDNALRKFVLSKLSKLSKLPPKPVSS